jgi:hypothetical protein
VKKLVGAEEQGKAMWGVRRRPWSDPIVLLAMILPMIAPGWATAADDPTLIAPGSAGPGPVGAQTGPRTDGATILWRDGVRVELRAARLDSRLAIAVTPAAGMGLYDVDGNFMVWAATRNPTDPAAPPSLVKAHELATGREVTVADLGKRRVTAGPTISHGRVVWAEDTITGALRIMSRDLTTMAAPIFLANAEQRWSVRWLTLDGERLAWAEEADNGSWRIRTLLLSTPAPVTLAEDETASFSVLAGLDVAGDLVVYAAQDQRQLVAVDLRIGQRRPVALDGLLPTTDGRYVFAVAGTIQGYDRLTDSRFIATGGMGDTAPTTGGGALAWQRGPVHASAVHAARINDLLPSAYRPAPPTANPDQTYFPETGHRLASGFLGFWERSGGLPVFGFPLTEEFEQRTADASSFFTVQVLERQRFEYHPELAGSPYEVSLGRLGVEDAAQRADLRGAWAFNPVPATVAHPVGCRYVPETQHRLCGEFRPYWETHGLELGDPGVSGRESLALFGYPISEEFIDPHTGLITQYFERAVFEYHAELPPGQRVLLRRLGAGMVARWGW